MLDEVRTRLAALGGGSGVCETCSPSLCCVFLLHFFVVVRLYVHVRRMSLYHNIFEKQLRTLEKRVQSVQALRGSTPPSPRTAVFIFFATQLGCSSKRNKCWNRFLPLSSLSFQSVRRLLKPRRGDQATELPL